MPKPISLKIDEEQLARWDAYAEHRGYTRTSLIKAAVEFFLGEAGVPPPREIAGHPIVADAEKRTPPVYEPESQPPTRKTPRASWGGIGSRPPIQKRSK